MYTAILAILKLLLYKHASYVAGYIFDSYMETILHCYYNSHISLHLQATWSDSVLLMAHLRITVRILLMDSSFRVWWSNDPQQLFILVKLEGGYIGVSRWLVDWISVYEVNYSGKISIVWPPLGPRKIGLNIWVVILLNWNIKQN